MILSYRWIPEQIPRARQRVTAMFRATWWLQLGVEWNPLEDEVGPLANVALLRETRTRPAVMIGTSSDRIGTPEGRAYFVTVSKDLTEIAGVPFAPYLGVSYGTYEDRLRPVGGFNLPFARRWSTLWMYDGKSVTPTVTWEAGRHVSVSALWHDFQNAGVTLSVFF